MLSDRLTVLALGLLFASGAVHADPQRGSAGLSRLSDVERRIFESGHSHYPGGQQSGLSDGRFRQQQHSGYGPAGQRQHAETGFQLGTDGSRPALEYRLNNDSSLRLRGSRRGARLMFSLQF